MVLRDERDKLTSNRKIRTCKTRADAKRTKRDSNVARRKSRTTRKKNIGGSIVLSRKKKSIVQEDDVEINMEVCSICCEATRNLKYVNCKRKCIQRVNFGKYGECCKDKPICNDCRVKCCNKCPFCKGHSLRSFKNKFPKKKPPFAVLQERLRLKNEIKEKKRTETLRVNVRRSQYHGFSGDINRRILRADTYTPSRMQHNRMSRTQRVLEVASNLTRFHTRMRNSICINSTNN